MADYDQEYFTRDGHRLGFHRYRRGTELAVVVLPAMGVPAGYYRRFALELADTGADVTVADLRGTGKSKPRPTRAVNFGYSDLVGDVGEFFDQISPELADRKVLLIGHSLGGQLAALHLAARQHGAVTGSLPIHALSLIASGVPYHALYGWRSPMLYSMGSLLSTSSSLYGHWPGYGFAGRQPRRLIHDWTHTVHKGRFVDIGGVDLDPHLGKVELPVLAVTIDSDNFTPAAASRHLTDKLAAATVTEHHYTTTEAGAQLNHFKWAQASAPLVSRLRSFIDAI